MTVKPESPATSPGQWGLAATLRLGVAVSLLGGLLQNGLRVAARLAGMSTLDHGIHAWWMTPLGDAMLIIPMAFLLAGVGRFVPSLRAPAAQLPVLLFPLMLTALWLVGARLHFLALLSLAAGAATLVARAVAGRRILDAMLRRGTTALLVLTAAVAIPFSTWPLIREALDERGLGPASDSSPNVLVLLWDTARAASMDLYGYRLPTTPYLRALAATGVTFDRAYGTASYTLPSHSSLFTGLWAHELSSDWQVPLNGEPRTLAEVLGSSGYRTGAFSANRFYVTREFGLGRGFQHFEEHRLGFQNVIRSSTLVRAIATSGPVRDLLEFNNDLARVQASAQHRALVQWLERNRERPFFAFVNLMEAHGPYLPGETFAHRFGWYAEDAPDSVRRSTRASARGEPEGKPFDRALAQRVAYDASIAQLDSLVHVMLTDLQQRRLLENTIVVVTADHGEEFGEQKIFGHGNSLFAPSLHIPLVISFPGRIPGGQRVSQAVSIRDVPATILDLVDRGGQMPGVSLRALWESSAPAHPALSEIRQNARLPGMSLARQADLASIADDSLQVIRHGNDIQVFDLSVDLMGITAGDTTSQRFQRLRSLLPPPRMPNGGPNSSPRQ